MRMIESLQDDFSRVQDEIGEDEFLRLAQEYLEAHPSTFADLAEFSRDFPQFLKSSSQLLYELAAVDWICIESGYAAAANHDLCLDLEEIQSGLPFRVRANISTRVFSGEIQHYMAFRTDNWVQVREISGNEAGLLRSLQLPLSLDQLAEVLKELHIDSENFQNLILAWIRDEVLVCERIKS